MNSICRFVVLFGAVTVFLCQAGCRSQERAGESPLKVSELNRVKYRCDLWEAPERLVYDAFKVDENGRESPYATMELNTRRDGLKLLMNDSITYEYGNVYSARALTYVANDLLRPLEVTQDISTGWGRTLEPVKVDLSQDILVYNAMLRLVRLLDSKRAHCYQFRRYAPVFIFCTLQAEEDRVYTLEISPVSNDDPHLPQGGSYMRMQIMGSWETEIWIDADRRLVRVVEKPDKDTPVVFKLRENPS